jgi:bacillithiol synthase
MKSEKVTFEETGCFSPLFLDYLNKKVELEPFYQAYPSIENFKEIIENRVYSDENRTELVQVLQDEYGQLRISDAVDFNIHSLQNERTFTVTTGHQLNIFTGPLYFIYKITTVIRICQELKKEYPDYHFVPVFWMASEDHDLAEINHFNLFGKTYTWETTQKGPVGRIKPHSIVAVMDQLADHDISIFEKAYLNHGTLADAVRDYVNRLFGDQGVVVVDGDNKTLKSIFAPVIKEEIEKGSSHALVAKASGKLKAMGYSDQAFSREVNFFYMQKGIRERIVKEGDRFNVLNTDISFSSEEILKLIDSNPEKFSPNVILRPLYEESVLPNLAYVGGPAEVAYWLQLKDVFDHYQVSYPIVMPRNFALIVNKGTQKKIEKLKLKGADLFKSVNDIKEAILDETSLGGFDLEEERIAITQIFDKLKERAAEIDASLTGYIGAESAGTFKALDNIAKRLKKAEMQNNDVAMSQVDSIKEKLFPNGKLQERHDNLLSFYLNNPDFIKILLAKFKPFDFHFQIIRDM